MSGRRESQPEVPRWEGAGRFARSLDAMLLADDERRYVDANHAACVLSGLPRETLLERRIDDFLPPESRGGLDVRWGSFLTHGHDAGEYDLALPHEGRPDRLRERRGDGLAVLVRAALERALSGGAASRTAGRLSPPRRRRGAGERVPTMNSSLIHIVHANSVQRERIRPRRRFRSR